MSARASRYQGPVEAIATSARRADTWEAITEACAELGPDELRVIAHLARRLLAGQRAYGKIDLAHDPRDFKSERADEIADLLVYTAFETLRLESSP